jgi:hypothetical protein
MSTAPLHLCTAACPSTTWKNGDCQLHSDIRIAKLNNSLAESRLTEKMHVYFKPIIRASYSRGEKKPIIRENAPGMVNAMRRFTFQPSFQLKTVNATASPLLRTQQMPQRDKVLQLHYAKQHQVE